MKDSSKEELKWQAESIVRHAVETTPQFRKAVRQTITELLYGRNRFYSVITRQKPKIG